MGDGGDVRCRAGAAPAFQAPERREGPGGAAAAARGNVTAKHCCSDPHLCGAAGAPPGCRWLSWVGLAGGRSDTRGALANTECCGLIYCTHLPVQRPAAPSLMEGRSTPPPRAGHQTGALGVSEVPRSLHPVSWSRNLVSEAKSSLGMPPGSPAPFPSLSPPCISTREGSAPHGARGERGRCWRLPWLGCSGARGLPGSRAWKVSCISQQTPQSEEC